MRRTHIACYISSPLLIWHPSYGVSPFVYSSEQRESEVDDNIYKEYQHLQESKVAVEGHATPYLRGKRANPDVSSRGGVN
jgi:hypothetical protein